MRPLKLEIQAFGPYVAKQCIDFQMFEERSLFLIQGETGSGKTMILDAITYALYGKSSGGDREDLERMRSRFAKDDEDTYIDFIFSLQNHIYRFLRKIEVKTKKNKEKTYKMSVDAGEVIHGEYHPFFEKPKLKNIEEKAHALIGLSHDQFIQVMILPQGKFEQLLTSKSEEKQEILKTLFQVDRWEKMNAYLIDKLRDERMSIEEKKQQIQAYVKGLDIHDPEAIVLWLKDVSHKESAYGASLKESRETLRQKRLLLEQQKTFHTWKLEQEAAFQKECELKQQEDCIQRYREVIALQKKLMEVKRYIDALTTAKEHHTQRLMKLNDAEASFSIHKKQMEDRKQKEEQLSKQETSYAAILSELDKLHDKKVVYEQYHVLKAKQRMYQKQVEEAHMELEKEQLNLEKLTALHNDIDVQMKMLRLQLVHKSEIDHLFTLWEQASFLYQKQKDAVQGQRQAQQRYEVLLREMDEQKKCLEELTQQHEKIYRQFLNNSASQLVQFLKEGEPCPICGSLHHPMPYAPKEGYADIMMLKQIQEQLDKEKAALDVILRNLQLEEAQIKTSKKQEQAIHEEIVSILHIPFDLQKYENMKQEVHSLSKKEQVLKELQKRLEQDELIIQEKEMLVHKLEEAYQNRKTASIIVETEVKHSTTQLVHGISSLEELSRITAQKTSQFQTMKNEIEQLRIYIQDVVVSYEKSKDDVKNCTHEAKQALQSEQQAKHILYEQCKKRNLALEELAGLKTEAEFRHMEELVHTYEIAAVQVATTLQNVSEKLQGVCLLDEKQLQEEITSLEEQDAMLAKDYAQIVSTKKLYEQVHCNIKKIQQELALEEPLFIKLSHFVKAMRGDNGIGIERYVLGVMLSSITQSANQLLTHVHQGRYQIYRSDEASGRTRKYGLELSIYDSYTCSYRSVVSLSGGEKFLVSLALSLSLSAVVQARNGGIHLEAMFIDEGFGTLDEHSIADALQVLQRMSSHKGIVGIISHVDLLKENIGAGIEVVKTRQGSSLTLKKG